MSALAASRIVVEIQAIRGVHRYCRALRWRQMATADLFQDVGRIRSRQGKRHGLANGKVPLSAGASSLYSRSAFLSIRARLSAVARSAMSPARLTSIRRRLRNTLYSARPSLRGVNWNQVCVVLRTLAFDRLLLAPAPSAGQTLAPPARVTREPFVKQDFARRGHQIGVVVRIQFEKMATAGI